MEIPKLIEELLPKGWFTSLSSAIALAVLVQTIRSLISNGAGKLFSKDTLWSLRVFSWSFILFLGVQSLFDSADTPGLGELRVVPWSPVAVGAVYAVSEVALYLWLLQLRHRKTLLPDEYLRKCANILLGRQENDGGFRVKSGVDSRSELWTTAQVTHALIDSVDRAAIAGMADRALAYYRKQLTTSNTFWSVDPKPHPAPLVTASSWTVLSLTRIAVSKHWGNLNADGKCEVRAWIKSGLAEMADMQSNSGGWSPLGSKNEADDRCLPTVVALWSMASALDAREAAELSETEVREIVGKIGRGWRFLEKELAEADGEFWWAPNPRREWRQRCSALTLLTFGVALGLGRSLAALPRTQDEAAQLSGSILDWAKSVHGVIMRHVDHCLHRDLEDNEADGPWDHNVHDRSGNAADVPITYFDWPTSALYALRMCKATDLYDHSDASREQALAGALLGRQATLEYAYSFRLAMILIASAVDEPLRSL